MGDSYTNDTYTMDSAGPRSRVTTLETDSWVQEVSHNANPSPPAPSFDPCAFPTPDPFRTPPTEP